MAMMPRNRLTLDYGSFGWLLFTIWGGAIMTVIRWEKMGVHVLRRKQVGGTSAYIKCATVSSLFFGNKNMQHTPHLVLIWHLFRYRQNSSVLFPLPTLFQKDVEVCCARVVSIIIHCSPYFLVAVVCFLRPASRAKQPQGSGTVWLKLVQMGVKQE